MKKASKRKSKDFFYLKLGKIVVAQGKAGQLSQLGDERRIGGDVDVFAVGFDGFEVTEEIKNFRSAEFVVQNVKFFLRPCRR